MFKIEKQFKKGRKRISGRNNQGKITIRHRGGGIKRKFFYIDFFRNFSIEEFEVFGFSYTTFNKSSVAILKNPQNELYSILNVKGLKEGSKVSNVFEKEDIINSFFVGSSYFIGNLPSGSFVHNIENQPFSGGKLAKSAGCFATIITSNNSGITTLKLPSGNFKKFSNNCRVSYGQVYSGVKDRKLRKAGQSRKLGFRPTIRGVAINPCDHPHGGGEGKSYIGRIPVSPWGSIKKGKKK